MTASNGFEPSARQNLRIPGPTPLPPSVREALSRDMVNYRGGEFGEAWRECIDGLRWAFQTSQDVIMMSASGTGGLESAVANVLSPGQKVLMASIGFFGDRFGDVARAYNATIVPLETEWGQALSPDAVTAALEADPEIETVFLTHNETSTGVLNPLAEIARAIRATRPDAIIAVDAVSSAGGVAILTDEWDCDVVVSASQKAWMTPPGLAFVTVSERAWRRQSQSKNPRRYFDWLQYKRASERSTGPWTPNVGAIFALQAALREMRREGLETIFERHERIGEYTRSSLQQLGLRLFADQLHASPTVTTAHTPDGLTAPDLLQQLRENHNVVMAAGMGDYANSVIRIGHLGFVTEADMQEVMNALQVELQASGLALSARA